MRKSPSSHAMQGQALTELVVCAAILVPFFLLIPLIGKFAHANQMAQQAARNAAWAATVAKDYDVPTRQLQQREALARMFAAADAPIRSNPAGPAQGAFDDPLLNTFSGKKLLERDNLQVAQMGNAESPGYLDNALKLLPRLGHFPPNANGYVTAEVQLRYRNLENQDGSRPTYLAPFDALDVVQVRKQSLLTDAWNASGPRTGSRSVIQTVKPLVPAATLLPAGLEKVFKALKPLSPVLPMVGSLGDLEIGTIEPDVVPADKLDRYPVPR